MAKPKLSVVIEIEKILSGGWNEYFSFDVDAAEVTGVVSLCWTTTGARLPLRIQITQTTFENGTLNYREIRDQLKALLPSNIIKQLCSDAKYLLRNADRRHLKDVYRDFKKWTDHATQSLRNIYGPEAADEFSKSVEVPSPMKNESIQALQYLVQFRTRHLQEL